MTDVEAAEATEEPTVTESVDTESLNTEAEAETEEVVVATPDEEVGPAIEAVCMVSDQPVPASLLADVLSVSIDKVESTCADLAAQYGREGRGFTLVSVAGGWRFQSNPAQAQYVEKFVLDGQTAKLSGAALETLAIVAYKQPISRTQIAAIRGVNVDGVLKTLQQRGYVADLGQDPGASQAILFGTTTSFLEKLGISSLADLPPLGDFFPGSDLVEALEQGLRPSAPEVASIDDGA